MNTIFSTKTEVDMGCPVCKTKLVFVREGTFETLLEHVSDPNGDVCKKDGFGCPNEKCEAHTKGLLWISDGEGPYSTTFDKTTYIDNNPYPFRTWHRQYEAEKERDLRIITIKGKKGSHSLLFGYASKANENGKRNYLFSRFNFKLIINGCYYTPGIDMFFYSLGSYLNKNMREFHFKEHIRRVDLWDKRWWSLLSLFIASIVWRRDYKKALEKKEQ